MNSKNTETVDNTLNISKHMMNKCTPNNKSTLTAVFDSSHNSAIYNIPNTMIFLANDAEIAMSKFLFLSILLNSNLSI